MGAYPDATAVFDVDSIGLVRIASHLNEGMDLGGNPMGSQTGLLIGVGAGLGHYTTEAGYLYPNAKTVQIDLNPRGLYQGLRIADMHIRADAKATAEAVLTADGGHLVGF